MVPPIVKSLTSNLVDTYEGNKNDNFKVQSSSSNVGELKQHGNKMKLSFKHLKDVWLHKKRTPSAVSSKSVSTNQLSIKNEISDSEENSIKNTRRFLETNVIPEEKEDAIHNVYSNLSVNNRSATSNQNIELQNCVTELERTNRELHQKNLELTEKKPKMEIITKHSEKDEKEIENFKGLEEELVDSKAQIIQLQQDLELSEENIIELKQEVLNLIHSINSKDDSNLILSLKKEISKRDYMIKESVEAGDILLEDMDQSRKLLKDIGKELRINWARLKTRRHTLVDLFHISRSCISELSRQVVASHNETDSTLQKMKEEYLKHQNDVYVQKDQIHTLNEKLNFQMKHSDAITEENIKLKGKNKKLEDQIENLEKYSLEARNSYEAQVKKLSSEYSEKYATALEKQEFLQNQITESMSEKANLFDELKVVQKENSSLLSCNKMHTIQIHNLKHDLESEQESCRSVKNKLQQELEVNAVFKNKLISANSEIEELKRKCKEQEYTLADGEMWCLGMHQQDQAIVQELEVCLIEKEHLIDVLQTQGECSKTDFEKLQAEVNLRKSKMEELKRVLADFEKKREEVVKDQKEFYSKIKALNKTATLRERVCENLIREGEKKSKIIKSLERKLSSAENTVIDTKEQSQKEIEELQTELKGAVERLREYENHVEIMDRDLERQTCTLQNNLAEERLQKSAALEKLLSYQNCIEEMKKDNEKIRINLQNCEAQKKDLEKVAESYQKEKAAFDLFVEQEQELRHKVITAETQEQDSLRDLKIKKSSLEQSLKKISTLQKKLQESQNHQTESKNIAQQLKQDLALLQEKVRILTFEKQQLETKLNETTKDRNFLQKDHEELCNKLISSVKMIMDAKLSHQESETQVHNLKTTIDFLQKEKKNSEAELESLKDTVNKTQVAIKMLEVENPELCKEIERFLTRPQNQNDLSQKYENCIKRLNKQLLHEKEEARKMLHQHTQQYLHLQADKQRLEDYVDQMNDKQNLTARDPQLLQIHEDQ